MFVNLTILSRYTHDELIIINTVILAGVSVIIISYYFKKLIDKLISKRKKHLSKLKEQRRRNQSKLILKQAQFIVCFLLIKKSY